jgi:hypothetical protein
MGLFSNWVYFATRFLYKTSEQMYLPKIFYLEINYNLSNSKIDNNKNEIVKVCFHFSESNLIKKYFKKWSGNQTSYIIGL